MSIAEIRIYHTLTWANHSPCDDIKKMSDFQEDGSLACQPLNPQKEGLALLVHRFLCRI